MKVESYTPGHSENATDFMAQRSLESHGAFFLPYLIPGVAVLDCGCGPGTVTSDMAARVAPGPVVGVDVGASQIKRATAHATQAAIGNVTFSTADCYALPFGDNRFDRLFSHALLEHLSDPVRALREWYRVLKPGGVIGVCSPDWGGFLLAPPSPALYQAREAYTSLQTRNGGDVGVGQKLGVYLATAGFTGVQMAARYECYPSLNVISDYLALQLERVGDGQSAQAWRSWSQNAGGMFAQAWVSAIARKD